MHMQMLISCGFFFFGFFFCFFVLLFFHSTWGVLKVETFNLHANAYINRLGIYSLCSSMYNWSTAIGER